MTLTFETINEIIGVDDSFKMPSVLMEIIMNKERREVIFKKLLSVETDLSFDWFHIYFQEEYAERKTKKQDFTPESISKLLTEIIRGETTQSSTLDVAAGTGGLTITKWHEDMRSQSPFNYRPSNHFYQLEELSDRALPFLLFNLLIRGMNATVIHGDALHRKAKQIYFIQNDDDDFLGFSSLNVLPHDNQVSKVFGISEWLEEPIKHIESPIPPFVEELIRNEIC